MNLPPGYRALEPLAQRGATEVLLAEPEAGGSMVVIKRLRPELADDEDARAGFLDEGRILAQLDHPGVVRLLAHGEYDGAPYHVLGHIDGPNLQDVLRATGSIFAPTALYIARRLAEALSYVHQARDAEDRPLSVVHRDVTPDNVLIDAAGEVRLVDFGIARARGRLARTEVGFAKGKLAFMAPEQLRGEPVDGRADVFGLGCTLHALLTGASPMADDAARREVAAGGSLRLSEQIPADVRPILQSCLQTAPADRPDAQALATQLAALSDDDARAVVARLAGIQAPELPTEVIVEPAPVPTATPILLDLDPSAVEQEHLLTPLPPLEPGAWIGDYRVLGPLGSGGFAEVLEVEHVAFGGRYALKRLRPTGSVRRFSREIEALERIDHPRVIRLVAHGLTEHGEPFLVTDRLDGETLSAVLARQVQLAPRVACRIACDIAEALQAVHAAGLVHRDLHPDNVLVVEEQGRQRAILLDFGLALLDLDGHRSRITAQGSWVGSLAFTAPEQLADAHAVTAAADLHALGVLLYCMVAGAPPVPADPEAATRWIRGSARPQWPGPLGPIISAAWDPSPQRRPTADAIAERLRSVEPELSDVPPRGGPAEEVSAGGTAWPDQTATAPLARRPGAPPRSLAFAGLVVLVAGSAGLITWVLSSRGGDAQVPSAAPAAAPAAVTVQPAVVVQLDPPPVPPPRVAAPPRPRTSAAAPPPAPPSSQEILRRMLVSRRMRASDLERDPQLSPLYREWNRSRPGVEERRAFEALQGGLQDVTLGAAHLGRRLDALRERLARAAPALPQDELQRIERRYLDLRAALGTACSPSGCRRFARDISKLERQLEAAAR